MEVPSSGLCLRATPPDDTSIYAYLDHHGEHEAMLCTCDGLYLDLRYGGTKKKKISQWNTDPDPERHTQENPGPGGWSISLSESSLPWCMLPMRIYNLACSMQYPWINLASVLDCRRPSSTSTRGIYETLRNIPFHGVCYQ